MINATKERSVEKIIQLKKRTILHIMSKSDFWQNKIFGIDRLPDTQTPTTLLPTTSTFE
jgi:hypothetical protein